MYKDFYKLSSYPFDLTPDSSFFYVSPQHSEALHHLIYGINQRKGFMLVTGEVGTGKTTVARTFLNIIKNKNVEVAMILNSSLNDVELLQAINRDFDIDHESTRKEELIHSLNKFLLELKHQQKTAIIIIDEAQNLKHGVLEQLRMLSNLETEKEKLLQIILIGQPEINAKLASRNLRQLNQRISIRSHLRSLSPKETSEYVNFRLRVAGNSGQIQFSPGALRLIHKKSKGIPRITNALCDRALLIGYVQNTFTITKNMIEKATHEVMRQGKRRILPWQGLLVGTGITTLLICSIWTFSYKKNVTHTPQRNSNKAASRTVSDKYLKSPKQTPQTRTLPKPVAPTGQTLERVAAPTMQPSAAKIKSPNAFGLIAGFFGRKANSPPVTDMSSTSLPATLQAWAAGIRLRVFNSWATLPMLQQIRLPLLLHDVTVSNKKQTLVWIPDKDSNKITLRDLEGKQVAIRPTALRNHWKGNASIFYPQEHGTYRVLWIGSRGPDVALVQERLKKLGYPIREINGIYNETTSAAVSAFQKACNVPTDSVLSIEEQMALSVLCNN